MKKQYGLGADQRGVMNALLIPLILTIILLVVSLGFGAWAFMQRQDYKNNVDSKIATASANAVTAAETKKDNEFIEREKQPLKSYASPSQYGSISIKYPKTWSAYIDESGKGSAGLDGYLNPNIVPGISTDTAYALRIQVVDQNFADVVRSFDSAVKQGKAKSQAYQPVNVKGVVGVRIDGEIASKQQGIIVLLPLRDKTIKLYTQSDQYFADFNNNILPNFVFTP